MPSDTRFTETLLARCRTIKVLLLDVDGVLTDGGLLYSAQGETLKRFHTLDGHGLKMLHAAGITVAVITGRDSEPLRARLQALGISHARYGIDEKLPAARDLLTELKFEWSQAAAMGDDWPDWPMMHDAALRLAPLNAHHEILSRADFVTRNHGGHGAVREVCDLLLSATGHYQRITARYQL
jgi:3-deoxy-D-manno-octulosonate 8-phosphate phosphatase (KDO 8-P phosphatase)